MPSNDKEDQIGTGKDVAQATRQRSLTVRDGDGAKKTTNMTVTTAPDGTNSYTQVGATSTRYADNGSADGNGSKPEQATDNTGDIGNEINRDFRDPVRNALGAAAAAAQAAHDFADPCMGAKTSAGCGGAIGAQFIGGKVVYAIAPIFKIELKGTHIFTDQAGKDSIERGQQKIFTSTDEHVEGLAHRIDGAWGNVVGTNVNIRTANGTLVTDADILLSNGVVQVKGGTGKGIADQLKRTEDATGLPAVGYTPDAGKHVLRGACTTNCAETLIDTVKP